MAMMAPWDLMFFVLGRMKNLSAALGCVLHFIHRGSINMRVYIRDEFCCWMNAEANFFRRALEFLIFVCSHAIPSAPSLFAAPFAEIWKNDADVKAPVCNRYLNCFKALRGNVSKQ